MSTVIILYLCVSKSEWEGGDSVSLLKALMPGDHCIQYFITDRIDCKAKQCRLQPYISNIRQSCVPVHKKYGMIWVNVAAAGVECSCAFLKTVHTFQLARELSQGWEQHPCEGSSFSLLLSLLSAFHLYYFCEHFVHVFVFLARLWRGDPCWFRNNQVSKLSPELPSQCGVFLADHCPWGKPPWDELQQWFPDSRQ